MASLKDSVTKAEKLRQDGFRSQAIVRARVSEPVWRCGYGTAPLNPLVAEDDSAMAPALYEYDAFGNFTYGYLAGSNLLETLTETPVKTKTGIRRVTYNAENRPVKFTSEDGSTIVECAYDYLGRRTFRKVTTDGAVTLHQRYIYRGYLQIAALDLVKANHPVLWHIIWDPTQPVATRPLAIRKDGVRYAYGWDLTKNICDVYGQTGYIRTLYTYTPYGDVTADGDVEQPIRWSSEFNDEELGLVYYSYRHYSSHDGRWLSRDAIFQLTELNTYAYVNNNIICLNDILGNSSFAIKDQENSIGGFGAGHEIYFRQKTYIRLEGEPYYMQFIKYSQRRIHPAKGRLWIVSKKDNKKIYHLDIDKYGLHHNVRGGIGKVKGFAIADHSRTRATLFGETIVLFKYSGRALFVAGIALSAYDIYHADDMKKEVTRQVGGWIGTTAGAWAGAKGGAWVGATAGSSVAGAGAAPGAVVGGFIGGVIGGVIGWWVGTTVTETIYDWIFTPPEKEEYVICKEE